MDLKIKTPLGCQAMETLTLVFKQEWVKALTSRLEAVQTSEATSKLPPQAPEAMGRPGKEVQAAPVKDHHCGGEARSWSQFLYLRSDPEVLHMADLLHREKEKQECLLDEINQRLEEAAREHRGPTN